MKKLTVVMTMAAATLLTACSGGAKEKVADVTVEEGQYVQLIEGDQEDENNLVSLKIKVKNTSKEKMYIFSDSFYLAEKGKDDRTTPLQLDYENGVKDVSFDVSPGKSGTGTVVFEVDQDKDYELVFSSMGIDEEGNASSDVEVPLDLSKYENSKKELENPQKALQAYMDVVFLNKENEDYDKLVANDSEKDQELFKKEYKRNLKDMFYKFRPSDANLDKAYDSFVAEQAKKATFELKLDGNMGDVAQVDVDFKGISNDSVLSLVSDARSDFIDKSDEYDGEKAEMDVFKKLPSIYSEADLGEPRQDLAVFLTQKDGKWSIDYNSSKYYGNKMLLEAYVGQVD